LAETTDKFGPEAFTLQKEILLSDWASGKTAIRDLDGVTFKIKGWAIAVFSATLAAGVALRVPSLPLFAVLSSVLFWALDALFKSFQHRFILRDMEIGRYLASEQLLLDQKDGAIPPDFVAKPFYDMERLSDGSSQKLPPWFERFLSRVGIKRASFVDLLMAMKLRNVSALYASLIALSFILWLCLAMFMAPE
jgi:hypothetical protein